jgi:hypothetical protein
LTRITTKQGKAMNNMNFFGWIRDGVRQSVLLGVSDAVEQLGSPAATDDIHPSVAGLLNVERNSGEAPKMMAASSVSPKGRKRLGRSLKDIGTENK